MKRDTSYDPSEIARWNILIKINALIGMKVVTVSNVDEHSKFRIMFENGEVVECNLPTEI